jgi:hypothetical protein
MTEFCWPFSVPDRTAVLVAADWFADCGLYAFEAAARAAADKPPELAYTYALSCNMTRHRRTQTWFGTRTVMATSGHEGLSAWQRFTRTRGAWHATSYNLIDRRRGSYFTAHRTRTGVYG